MPLLILFLVLLAGPIGAEGTEPTPSSPPPVLEKELIDALPLEYRKPVAFWVAVGGSASGIALAAWGFGSALSNLDVPGGPPLGTTVAGLTWGTILLAAAGLGLDYLVSAP